MKDEKEKKSEFDKRELISDLIMGFLVVMFLGFIVFMLLMTFSVQR